MNNIEMSAGTADENSTSVECTSVTPQLQQCNVSCRTFSFAEMEAAFQAGINRGCDLTLMIEYNGNHSAINGYPSFNDWMMSMYGS